MRHAIAALVLFTFATAVSQQQAVTVAAYHDGETLRVTFQRGVRPLTVGPWTLGTPLRRTAVGKPEKISDRRKTIYFAVRGSQHRSENAAYDHNLIVNVVPADEAVEAEADLFWVIELDPRLQSDLKTEAELIVLAQERFMPGDLFAVEDAPGGALLRDKLGVTSLADLKKYRLADGTLPRLLIVPANMAFAITVER